MQDLTCHVYDYDTHGCGKHGIIHSPFIFAEDYKSYTGKKVCKNSNVTLVGPTLICGIILNNADTSSTIESFMQTISLMKCRAVVFGFPTDLENQKRQELDEAIEKSFLQQYPRCDEGILPILNCCKDRIVIACIGEYRETIPNGKSMIFEDDINFTET